jgi:hypothetical protein
MNRLGGSMSKKWNKSVLEEGGPEAVASFREQDDEFCRMLRAAVERSYEYCPTA